MQGVSDLIEKSFSVADQRSALRRYQYPNSMPSVGSAMREIHNYNVLMKIRPHLTVVYLIWNGEGLIYRIGIFIAIE